MPRIASSYLYEPASPNESRFRVIIAHLDLFKLEPHRNRWSTLRLIAKVLGTIALLWFIWSQWTPSTAERLSPAWLIASAVLLWACAFGITLFVYIATSIDDLFDVSRAALRASAPAMWLAPALLLLSTLTVAGTASGLLLIAYTARLLFSGSAPHKLALRRKPRAIPETGFLYTDLQPGLFSRDRFPTVFGAFAWQAGIFSIVAGYTLLSAALLAFAAALWTRSSIARGAYQPGKERARPSLLMIVLFLLLATTAPVGQVADAPQAGGASSQGPLDNAWSILRKVAYPPAPKPPPPPPQQTVTRVYTGKEEIAPPGKEGVPGVIMRPKTKRERLFQKIPRANPAKFSLVKPLTIPFTGEYHLFRASSGQLPPNSVVQVATPVETVYVTTNGRPLEMIAWQDLDPPIDFANCARIQLVLSTRELLPASVSLQLVAGNATENLGTEIFGLDGTPEEILEFAVPVGPRTRMVTAIRVVFRHNPMQASQSTKAAIQRFTLLPRYL